MKFSYNWLREFVPALDAPAEALERLITMKTAECEGVERVGALLAAAVPARVEAVEPIEGSHNLKAVVDAARYGRRTVVCGAPNCRPGVRAVYVPVGVKKISGVESDGMLASAAELEISRDHEGILELAGAETLPEPDSVIEIDNKSITHRPDLWGHHGMAREVAAITGRRLLDPVRLDLLPSPNGGVSIEIEDFGLCPRFSALVFDDVTVKPSPLWLQARLTAVGLNPINNIVDLSNLLMAELAQPTHAYDRAKLHGDTIRARPAREGERILALNKEEYELTPADLVIADAAGPIGIAGVIGGDFSAISEATTSIVLEAANFTAAGVRRTSAALRLRTDASMRFEKAQDPHNTVRALARALELLPRLSPGIRLVGGLADRGREWSQPAPVALDLAWLARKLGRAVGPAEVRRILQSLEFRAAESGAGTLIVQIPSWRATRDVALPEDLVEEVGRMVGYDSIDPQPPLVACHPSSDPPEREFLRNVRRMIAAQGFTEVSNYSFISEDDARRFGLNPADHVRVLNPIAEGQELMRMSLLPGIHRNIVENAKHFDSFRLFEVGREIHRRDNEKPAEITHLMAAIFSKDDGVSSLRELRRTAECIAPDLQIHPSDAGSFEHPARAANVQWNGKDIGRLCELHPDLVEGGRAAVLDVNLDLVRELQPPAANYTPVRRFPATSFDLSIVARTRELAGDLEMHVRQFAGPFIQSIEYVREYQGSPLAAGRKSVTFRVTAGRTDATLTANEITAIRNEIVEGMNRLGYELRA